MYIGNDLQIAHPSYKIIDDISSSFNGSTTSFALQVNGQTPVPFPISTQQVMISVNGVVQEPDPSGSAGFKLLGSNIVFSSAPANGHAFFGVINAGADYVTAGSEFPDGSATAPSFTFQDDQDTGWFRSGSGSVGYSANGVQTLTFDGNGLTVTGDASFVGDSAKNLLWDKSDGQLEFADNAKAIFGAGNDLEIYSDGSTCFLKSDDLRLRSAGNENYLTCSANGAARLFYNNTKKFETSNTGATVTGTLVSDGLDVNGNSTFGSNGSITSGGNFTLNSNALTVTGTATVVGQFNGATIPTVQVSQTTDNTDIQIRANATGGLVRTASNKPLVFGTNQIERMRIDSSGNINIGQAGGTINHRVTIDAVTNSSNVLELASDTHTAQISFSRSGDPTAYIKMFEDGAVGTGSLRFGTGSGASPTDSLVIDSSGRLLVGTTTEGEGDADNLTIADSGNCGISIRSGTSNDGAIFFSDGTSGTDEYKGTIQYTHSNDRLLFKTAATVALTLDSSQNATFAGTVSDSKGDLRKIPINFHNASTYTLAASDAGKVVSEATMGATITVPASTFVGGDAVTLMNHTGNNHTINCSAITMYLAGDTSAKTSLTLAGRGFCTIFFREHNVAYISGSGLS